MFDSDINTKYAYLNKNLYKNLTLLSNNKI
jgi:hypothetical protein